MYIHDDTQERFKSFVTTASCLGADWVDVPGPYVGLDVVELLLEVGDVLVVLEVVFVVV
jgi:hypothetical protein